MSDPLIGRTIDDLRLEALLGRGSAGRVYRATQLSMDRPVAVKLFEERLLGPPQLRQRFLREARVLARLEHPNIVPVYGAGHAGNLYYYVMRLIEGRTLEALLATGLPLAVGLRHLASVASALGYAHRAGLIHRDVKPANVMVSGGAAVLTDFGLAREDGAPTITATGALVGTPLYFAPEQARLERATERSDLYAVGLIAYQLATGRHPFAREGERAEDVIARIREGDHVPPRALAPDCPPAVAELIERALQPAPEARFADAAELREALLAAIDGMS